MDRISIWVTEYTDSLLSWALYKTSDQYIAEDLVQETFIAAFRSIESFKQSSHPKTWLFGILNYKILDYYRASNKKFETYDYSGSSSDELDFSFNERQHWKNESEPHYWSESDQNLLDNPEFRSVLNDCISRLKPDCQTVIRLKFIDGEKSDRVCQDLGITPTNLWQIIHRSKLQLRKCLNTHWFR